MRKRTTLNTQYRVIKEAVEAVSDIKDISIKDRQRYIIDCRYVYYHLCKKYIHGFILADCGTAVNRDHSTVIHGLKCFNQLFNQSAFTASKVYLNAIELVEDDFYFDNNISRAVAKLERLTNRLPVTYTIITP